MTKFEQWAATLDFQPMETLPWEVDNEFDPPRKSMPLGVVLKSTPDRKFNKYELVGNNVEGYNTTGCPCCSSEWTEYVYHFVGWAWMNKEMV